MGCTQSKIENEEAVTRCKQRKQDMKDAVAARNLFAAAHSAYTMALKNTGAALSDYGQGEVQDNRAHSPSASVASAAVAAAAVHPPMESLRPPPPLPDFSPTPLMRAASMPEISLAKSAAKPSETIQEEEDADEDDDDGMAGAMPNSSSHPLSRPPAERSTPPPPPQPDNRYQSWDFFLGPVHETMSSESMPEHEEEAPPPPPPPIEDDEMSSTSNKDIATEMTTEKIIAEPPVKISKKQKPGSSGGGSSSSQHLGVGPEGSKRGKGAAAAANVSLVEILNKLDDKFLKASVSAQEVSKMLEANRLHYHSNFADNRGHIDHSARVMRVITWNRSFKAMPNTDDGKDDFDAEESETHATVLDKLLAWEKKLYDEVKTGELMKLEYQRKTALLAKQKKRNISFEALEKTKAAVSHLHTRYIVDMQSMDSTVSEIHRLRDEQLYPKLVDLVDGMTIMWETMHESHREQLVIADDLRFLDTSNASKETSDQHHNRTRQLCRIAGEWNSQFMKLMAHQKEYIHALNNWVKLTLIPIESSLKEKVSSPPRVERPPIQTLLRAWHEQLDKLPVELAKSAISSFAAGVEAILLTQEEELKQKEKCEEATKEYGRKSRAFDDWHQKYLQRRTPSGSEEADPDRSAESGTQTKDPVAERSFVVESLKKKMEDEIEAHQKLCTQARDKSLVSLKTHLPQLFRVMYEFSLKCSETYSRLRDILHAHGHGSPD